MKNNIVVVEERGWRKVRMRECEMMVWGNGEGWEGIYRGFGEKEVEKGWPSSIKMVEY